MTNSCKECGKEYASGQTFCSNCGAMRPANENVAAAPVPVVKKSRKLTAVQKGLIGLLLVVVVGAVGAHYYLKNSTDPERMIQRFYNAVLENDVDTIAKTVLISEKDGESLDVFIANLKKQDMASFLADLRMQADAVYKDGLTKILYDRNGQEILKLKDMRKLGLYPYVQLVKVEKVLDEAEKVAVSSSKNEKLKMDGKEQMPVEEAKESSIYTTIMRSGGTAVDMYLVPVDVEMETVEFTSAFGVEGDREYVGTFAFYLANPAGDEQAVKQEQLAVEGRYLNIKDDMSQFAKYEFGDRTFLGFSEIEATNVKNLTLWMYEDGEMKEVPFNGYGGLGLANENIKIIGDQYVQSYSYDNSDVDNGVGWTFTTWKWNEKINGFTKHFEIKHTDKEDYGWETGDYHDGLWRNNDDYYVPFPQFTFTEQSKHMLTAGKLIDERAWIGMRIEDVLDIYPRDIENGYYEGAPYYSFVGGISYLYDESSFEVTYITYGGDALTNTVDDFINYFGAPEESGFDEMEMVDYHIFHVSDYRLRLNIKNNGDISNVWLSKW